MIAYILYRAKIDLGFIKYIVLFIQEEQFFSLEKVYTHIYIYLVAVVG